MKKLTVYLIFLALILLCFGVNVEAKAKKYYVYVAAESEDEVAVVKFEGQTASVEKRIPVGVWPVEIEGPHGMTISPDGEYWYLSMAHGKPYGHVYKYKTGTDEMIARVELDLFPATMQISPATGFLYVVNFNLHGDHVPSTVSIVDPESMEEIDRVTTGVMPHGFMTDKYMREVLLPNVKIGLDRAGRGWDDIEITGGGFTVFGETEEEIEGGLESLRRPISFYGSTRSYHGVFAVHGWRDLGEKLHALSVRGEWDEMARIIPEDVLRGFAQTSTYDKLPDFIRQQREYASRIGFGLPTRTESRRARLSQILKEIQAIETPGVPAGLE